MSVEVLSWVLRHSEEKLGRRLVLIVLADHANRDGTGAWPSVSTIAGEARLSERQVQNCLRDLEANGAIQQDGVSPHGTRIWTVLTTFGGGENTAPPGEEFASRGEIHDTEGVQSATSGGADIAPEPSLKQPSKDPTTDLAVVNGNSPAARPANPIWDLVVEFEGEPLPRNKAARGRIVSDLRELLHRDGITSAPVAVAEVRRRRQALIDEWGEPKATSRALVQNWVMAGRIADGTIQAARRRETRGGGRSPEEMLADAARLAAEESR